MILVELFSTEMTFSMTLQPIALFGLVSSRTIPWSSMGDVGVIFYPCVVGWRLAWRLWRTCPLPWSQECSWSVNYWTTDPTTAPVLLLITCWNWNLENVCHQHQQHIWISGYLPGHLTYLCININNSNSGILISTPHLQMKKLVNSFPPFLLIIRKAHEHIKYTNPEVFSNPFTAILLTNEADTNSPLARTGYMVSITKMINTEFY